jgi:hypothetical protein
VNRISSTPLGAFLRCPRILWYEHSGQPGSQPVVANEKMSFGTIFHAMVEFYQERGRLPVVSEFDRLKGNYDDPVVARKAFPHMYEPAQDTAIWLIENHPELFELPEDTVAEQDVEDWGLFLNNGKGSTAAGGYVDLLVPSQRRVIDWKTRGGFHYVPRTEEDFYADPQLCYFGACAAYHYGWESVTVEHRNVLRPDAGGPQLMVCAVDLPAYYLKGVWTLLDTKTAVAMREVVEQTDPREVERNTGGCYSKGKCSHLPYCTQSYNEAKTDPLAMLHAAIGIEEQPDPLEILMNGGD